MGVLSPSRKLALQTTSTVRERKAYVQQVATKTIHKARASREDKAFAELLATGVVSTWGTLDEIINRSLRDPSDIEPNVRDALRISAYEFAFLAKQNHAVVDQGVELVRFVEPKAANLANAVLRKMSRDMEMFPWGNPNTDDAALARKLGFPYWMTDMLVQSLGRNDAVVFMMVSNQPAPIFIASNNIMISSEDALNELKRIGAKPEYFGPSDRGCILCKDSRAAVRSDMLRDGRALVSDASAQLAALMAMPVKGKPFLEVGSGRGTKTVLLQSNALKYNGEQAEMYCVDLHAFKNGVLKRRVKECGLESTHLFEGDATKLDQIKGLPQTFGKALVDAPCSGLGTLRRHPEIRWNMSAKDIESLHEIDMGMLECVAPRIEVGGSIVYSTCTVTQRENQDVLREFLKSDAGKGYRLRSNNGKPYIQNKMVPDGPDVHFIAQLVRVE